MISSIHFPKTFSNNGTISLDRGTSFIKSTSNRLSEIAKALFKSDWVKAGIVNVIAITFTASVLKLIDVVILGTVLQPYVLAIKVGAVGFVCFSALVVGSIVLLSKSHHCDRC